MSSLRWPLAKHDIRAQHRHPVAEWKLGWWKIPRVLALGSLGLAVSVAEKCLSQVRDLCGAVLFSAAMPPGPLAMQLAVLPTSRQGWAAAALAESVALVMWPCEVAFAEAAPADLEGWPIDMVTQLAARFGRSKPVLANKETTVWQCKNLSKAEEPQKSALGTKPWVQERSILAKAMGRGERAMQLEPWLFAVARPLCLENWSLERRHARAGRFRGTAAAPRDKAAVLCLELLAVSASGCRVPASRSQASVSRPPLPSSWQKRSRPTLQRSRQCHGQQALAGRAAEATLLSLRAWQRARG